MGSAYRHQGRSTVGPPADTGQSPPAAPSQRLPETPAQRHARRVAWGKKWGAVGAEWKRQHNPKGR